MGKKRKSSGHGTGKFTKQSEEQTKYNVNETFADSEDEFFAGRDRILLDDGPSSKRRKLHSDGRQISNLTKPVVTKLKGL